MHALISLNGPAIIYELLGWHDAQLLLSRLEHTSVCYRSISYHRKSSYELQNENTGHSCRIMLLLGVGG